jgi:RNA polymerase sigma-70 factor, ECF subfamily
VADVDSGLADRAARGDQEACRELVARFSAPVFNLIVRLVRNEGVAQELAQDSFVKVFRSLHLYDRSQRLGPWVYRIAHNTAIDYLRRRVPAMVALDDTTDGDAAPMLVDERARSPFEHAELADLSAALDWALAQLRPEYRRLVVLRYQEDQSYEDIAAALGMPIGTVKSHLHRARQTMATLLEHSGWAPAGGRPGTTMKPERGRSS